MAQRFQTYVSVNLLLIEDNKILLLERQNTGYADGWYCVPGGHLNGNEPVSQAIVRETREEIGLDYRPNDLCPVHVVHRRNPKGDEWIDFFYVPICRHYPDEIKNGEPHKHGEPLWWELDHLPKKTMPPLRATLHHYHLGSIFHEYGWSENDHLLYGKEVP